MNTSEKILDAITKDDIIDLMRSFNVDYEITSNGDLRFESTCHGSNSKKLYYYERDADGEISKHFMCYSHCGGMSVFIVFMKINDWTFKETIDFLARYKNISTVIKRDRGFGKSKKTMEDWEFIEKYKKLESIKEKSKISLLPELDKNILSLFDNVYPSTWEDEGITPMAMKKFNIRFSLLQWKAIIPHYDVYGRLIGIRGRSFLHYDIEDGKKYMPIFIKNESYRHPLQRNLYGLYENLGTIKKTQKAIIFEGEKSVLLCESYYPKNNFSVALCGTAISNYQRDLLIHEAGVKEIIIALDKQYKTILETEKEIEEYNNYIKKVKKIADKFVNYVDVYIVYCDDERLGYKDAPCDLGKEILEELMTEKERYSKEDCDEI